MKNISNIREKMFFFGLRHFRTIALLEAIIAVGVTVAVYLGHISPLFLIVTGVLGIDLLIGFPRFLKMEKYVDDLSGKV